MFSWANTVLQVALEFLASLFYSDLIVAFFAYQFNVGFQALYQKTFQPKYNP